MLTPEQMQLVRTLAGRPNLGTNTDFDGGLSRRGKRWFCRRLAKNELADTPSISLHSLETAITAKISRTAELIQQWLEAHGAPDSPDAFDAPTTPARRDIERRNILHQIAACAIAVQPELGNSSLQAVFDQIVAQRLRIWERMRWHMNPTTTLAAFAYGGDSPSLSVHAAPYWAEDEGSKARWMLSDSGMNDPVKAIESLFTPASLDERNLVYCQHAATAVLLDSLIPLDGINGLDLSSLARNPGYFFLDTPYAEQPTRHYLNDDSSTGRFEQRPVPLDDLQIGDHVFAENSEYYGLLQPNGLWNGEHTIVTARFDSSADYQFGTNIEDITEDDMTAQTTIIEGLGLTGRTVKGIRNDLIEFLNLELLSARTRVDIYRADASHPPGAPPPPCRTFDPTPCILLRPSDPPSGNLEIYYDDTLPPTPEKTFLAWYLYQPGGPRHYLWVRKDLPPEFDPYLEDYVDPPDVAPNPFTIATVWGEKHPLIGPDKMVKVVRPKIAR